MMKNQRGKTGGRKSGTELVLRIPSQWQEQKSTKEFVPANSGKKQIQTGCCNLQQPL